MKEDTVFYVDRAGNYMGSYGNGAVPDNADHLILVTDIPPDAFAKWDGQKWISAPVKNKTPDDYKPGDLIRALIKKGVIAESDLE